MPADTRWEVLISSGCRLGQEFLRAWGVLRLEASQCAVWLDDELDGALAQPVGGAGMGCVTGATRKLVVEQLERLWGKVLKTAIDNHADRRVRPVIN